ncbi:MAG TPA: hypothetical protein VFP72_08350 [Kineosporiaceae bacterium]|nr:hypothetical protein [Kineosporiaceae bacterium]
MALTTLGVLVFGALTFVCWRAFGLRAVHALVAVLFGFFLASTLAAPAIRGAVAGLFAWVAGWHL